MEDIDDDFGELYADFELQPCTPVRCISELSTDKTEANKEAIQSKLESADDVDAAAAKVSSTDADFDSGSDSEDDLKILLNDDDGHSPSFPTTRCSNLRGGGFQDEDDESPGGSDKNLKPIDQSQVGNGLEHNFNCVGGGERGNGGKCGYSSQYKYIRPHAEGISSSKGIGTAGIGSFSFVSGRTEQEDSGCNQLMRSSSLLAQRKLNFSLPRSRTILDVNIDAFGYKPWKHPEADITDYFNFGFDEVSWKHYCNKLDQCRHGESMSTKILGSESRKTNETWEEERKDICLMTSPCEQNGNAIQVKDSNLDRQPSMEVMPPVYRDSDVIQINLQESKGESSGSLKGISALVDCSEFEMSGDEDSEHDSGEIRCFDSDKRPAKPPKERKDVRTDTDIYKRAYMSDDGYHHHKVEHNASNGTIEANMKKPNHKTGKFERMPRKHPSEAENTQYSPSSSFSGHLKRASWDSAASDYFHSIESRDCDAKIRDCEYQCYGERRQTQVYRNNHNKRIDVGLVPKSKTHLNADDRYSLYDAQLLCEKNRRSADLDDRYQRKDSYYRSPRGKAKGGFGVENLEYHCRNLDEEEFYLEERMSRMDDELMERDWFPYDCRLHADDMDPVLYKEQSLRRVGDSEFFPEGRPPSDIRWDRYEKPVPYDEKLPLNTRIPGRFYCRNRSHTVVFSDSRSMDQEDEFWRFNDRHAELHNSPRNDLYERHTKYKREIWTERSRESDVDVDIYIDNYDNDMVHQRHYWKSEVLHWKEAEIASLQKHMKPNIINAKKHGNEAGQIEWRMPKLMNQGNRGNRFGSKNSNVMCKGNYDQSVRKSNKGQENKFFGRFNAREGICKKVKPEHFTWNINVEKKKKISDESKVPQTGRLEQPSNKKFPAKSVKHKLDIEEGQIIGEEVAMINQNTAQCNQVKKSNKIHEVIAKMEKRRERFKEPIGLKNDMDPHPKPTWKITSESQSNLDGITEKRPARKRRWGGN